MHALTETVLSTVGRFSDRLNPVTLFMDRLIEHLAPQTTAQACSGAFCYYDCGLCARGGAGFYYYASDYNCNDIDCALQVTPCGRVC